MNSGKWQTVIAIREVQKGAGIYYLDDQYYSEKFGWSDDPVNGMKPQIVLGGS